MSTPSVTILKNLVLNWKSNQMEEETIATFYRHYDGYPSCHAIDIANSFVVASRTKPEQHIDFSGASVERNILNNRNWCQHFLKAMCMERSLQGSTDRISVLTGQGRSSSCKIWEAYIQSHVNETFPYTSILLPSGFRSLDGRTLTLSESTI